MASWPRDSPGLGFVYGVLVVLVVLVQCEANGRQWINELMETEIASIPASCCAFLADTGQHRSTTPRSKNKNRQQDAAGNPQNNTDTSGAIHETQIIDVLGVYVGSVLGDLALH